MLPGTRSDQMDISRTDVVVPVSLAQIIIKRPKSAVALLNRQPEMNADTLIGASTRAGIPFHKRLSVSNIIGIYPELDRQTISAGANVQTRCCRSNRILRVLGVV